MTFDEINVAELWEKALENGIAEDLILIKDQAERDKKAYMYGALDAIAIMEEEIEPIIPLSPETEEYLLNKKRKVIL